MFKRTMETTFCENKAMCCHAMGFWMVGLSCSFMNLLHGAPSPPKTPVQNGLAILDIHVIKKKKFLCRLYVHLKNVAIIYLSRELCGTCLLVQWFAGILNHPNTWLCHNQSVPKLKKKNLTSTVLGDLPANVGYSVVPVKHCGVVCHNRGR